MFDLFNLTLNMTILHKTTRDILSVKIQHLSRQLSHDHFASAEVNKSRQEELDKLLAQRKELDKMSP
jgi:hypothetical protein